MLTKFVGVFRELASFNELLHTQVELILVERLHRTWLKVRNSSPVPYYQSCVFLPSIASYYLQPLFPSPMRMKSTLNNHVMACPTIPMGPSPWIWVPLRLQTLKMLKFRVFLCSRCLTGKSFVLYQLAFVHELAFVYHHVLMYHEKLSAADGSEIGLCCRPIAP